MHRGLIIISCGYLCSFFNHVEFYISQSCLVSLQRIESIFKSVHKGTKIPQYKIHSVYIPPSDMYHSSPKLLI